MKDEHMLMYALVFVLGFVVARMMGGRLIEGRNTVNANDWVKSNDKCDLPHNPCSGWEWGACLVTPNEQEDKDYKSEYGAGARHLIYASSFVDGGIERGAYCYDKAR